MTELARNGSSANLRVVEVRRGSKPKYMQRFLLIAVAMDMSVPLEKIQLLTKCFYFWRGRLWWGNATPENSRLMVNRHSRWVPSCGNKTLRDTKHNSYHSKKQNGSRFRLPLDTPVWG